MRRLYWDTSVFLSFLSEEEVARRHICEDILQHARDGKVELITSMYAMVEVIRPKAIKWPAQLTDEQVVLLEGMFKWPWLKKIQVHEELGRAAARLARKHGLKPADAIHAATAIEEKADELQRWDYDYTKVSSLISVTEPAYLSEMPPLFKNLIGPTPSDFQPPTSPASTVPAQPSAHSPGAESPKASEPAPVRRVIRLDGLGQPQPDSSGAAVPPPRSEK